jgi:gamma-glutamylcyclotransferase (GGCT)/AIG2-like uncharacterized protein YtfP
MKEEKVIFATYGTLKRGFGNNRLLRDAEFIGEHTTEPAYTMYSAGGFPIVTTNGNTPIKCELFATTNPEIVKRVNALEGFSGIKNHPDNWYDRLTIQTPYGEAEMYVMDSVGRDMPVVESGEWQRYGRY